MHTAPDDTLAEVLREVRRIDIQSRRLVTDVMAGGYSSVFRGAGLEFESVREYVSGDDVRTVDWNVTARVGRPYVKTFVDERDLTVVFLLDISPSMSAGTGIWTPRQAAARVCACLALAASRTGDKVGLVTFGSRVESVVKPRKGWGHALRIVRDCLALPPAAGDTALGAALAFAAQALRRHAIVFVLSDFLSGGWERDMARVARRHDVVAVRLLPAELELPRVGLVRVRDPESGAQGVIDTSSARVRRDYGSRVKQWRDGVEQSLRRARVDRMDVPIPRVRGKNDIAAPILSFFRMRELRGVKR